MTNSNNECFLTPSELSNRWRRKESTLRNWRCQKRGPKFIKIEGGILYPLSEVLKTEEDAIRGDD